MNPRAVIPLSPNPIESPAQGPAPPGREVRWRRADGLQLLGPVQGSGLVGESFLVRRRDGQVVQVSELLYLVLSQLDATRSPDQVASAVSRAYGRTLGVDGLTHLIDTRLRPLGLVQDDDEDEPPDAPSARPILSLTLKGTLLPVPVVRPLAAGLQYAFWPPVVILALGSLVALDIVVFTQESIWDAVTHLFATPTLILLIYGLMTAGSVIHELGHAAACRYGGARPGVIGFGVYLVFPAFYTDVTDSYRLGRGGRLRTDLGGLYFHVWCVLGLGALFVATGDGVFLLTLVLVQVQMLQQLLPLVRFDGYYVLADLAGVPDLFARLGPVLRSLRPGRLLDPQVRALRPRARKIVVGWVLVVVPALGAALAWLVWNLPELIEQARVGIDLQLDLLSVAWPARDVAMVALSVLSIALILLPLVGIAVVAWRMLLALAQLVGIGRRGPEGDAWSEGDDPDDAAAVPVPLSAEEFTDARMLTPRRSGPELGWRKVVYKTSGGHLDPGPGAEERRRARLRRRLRTPVEGSRRIVVMSRKGGVGKTTMTLALGSTFALERGDRVVAVDANPDAGNLAHRVAPPLKRNITHVLQDLDRIRSYAQLRAYTCQSPESRLEVLASDDDPKIGLALDRNDYQRLITLLDRFYNLILLDTGTGILDSANQGLLAEADQVVLVLGPGLDGGRAAALTLDWMDEHGFEHLVAGAVVVVNGVRRGTDSTTDPMERHFERRCANVVSVPWDSALMTGAQTDMSMLQRRTRESLIEVAAAVADNFRETGVAR